MKQNLFVPEVKNHVSRNAFDLSSRKIYSQKLGEILPVLVQDCLPGDRFKIKASSFTRTAPLNSAAFARMKQYYNFYFVPYRLLYRDFPSFVVQQSASSKAARGIQSDSPVHSSLPYTTESELFKITKSYYAAQAGHGLVFDVKNRDINTRLLNPVGLNRMVQMRKLLQYLGYYRITCDDAAVFTNSATAQSVASANNTPISLFPLMAYQKVYNDFYRFSQWENEQANTYNVDYLAGGPSVEIPVKELFSVDASHKVTGYSPAGSYYPSGLRPSMFDMRYINYTKDSFLGVVPSSQFGAVSTVSTSGDELTQFYLKSFGTGQHNKTLNLDPDGNVSSSSSQSGQKVPLSIVNNDGVVQKFSFDILTLRAAQARQKFLEVTLSNNSDYKSQIEAHFNVKVSSLMSNLCDYIGGFSADLSLNTIANQNLSDYNVGSYSALATFQGSGDIDFEAREHGLIIGLSYILPFIDWSVIGYDFPTLRTEFSDFALPEFDRLGYEELDPRLPLGVQLSNFDATLGESYPVHIGYGPRYYDYKTNIDVCLGDFNKFQGGTQPNFVLTMRPNIHGLLVDQQVAELPYNVSDYRRYGSFGYLSDIVLGRLNYASFKVSPQLTNLLFNADLGMTYNNGSKLWVLRDDCSFDPFYNVCDFNITVIRNLDRLGLPY